MLINSSSRARIFCPFHRFRDHVLLCIRVNKDRWKIIRRRAGHNYELIVSKPQWNCDTNFLQQILESLLETWNKSQEEANWSSGGTIFPFQSRGTWQSIKKCICSYIRSWKVRKINESKSDRDFEEPKFENQFLNLIQGQSWNWGPHLLKSNRNGWQLSLSNTDSSNHGV